VLGVKSGAVSALDEREVEWEVGGAGTEGGLQWPPQPPPSHEVPHDESADGYSADAD
jgi:hypothetical protein